jgi:hypothetical protein
MIKGVVKLVIFNIASDIIGKHFVFAGKKGLHPQG